MLGGNPLLNGGVLISFWYNKTAANVDISPVQSNKKEEEINGPILL